MNSLSFRGQSVHGVTLYGLESCHYTRLARVPFASVPVYDLELGFEHTVHQDPQGNPIHKIHLYNRPSTARCCKAGLVNLVMHNVLMSKHINQPIIPCFFCIQTDDQVVDNDRLLTASRVYTSQEIRRVYKLCYDPSLPEEVRNMAQKTFLFVRVHPEQINKTDSPSALDGCFTLLPPKLKIVPPIKALGGQRFLGCICLGEIKL